MGWNGIRACSAVRGCVWIVMAVLLAGLGVPDRARAQPSPDSEEGPSLGGVTSSAGLGFYFPNKWGMAQAGVRNPGDEPIRPQVRFFFKDQMQRQFERRVWVPPRAQRRVPFPVRFDGSAEPEGDRDSSQGRSAEAETLLLTGDADRDRELSRSEALTRIVKGRMPFAIVTSSDQSREDHVIKAMGQIREHRRLPPRMGYLRDRDLMHFEAAWEGLAVVALVGNTPRLDAAQRRALKRWIQKGGTLVVFAHRTDNATMSQLLGEAWGIDQVDRVTLNTVRFREPGDGRAAAAAAGTADEGETRSELTVERPIRMARVIAPGYETELTVRGWPALLRRSVGRGQIVVPTIGGRAWRHEDAEEALSLLAGTMLGRVSRDSSEGKADTVVRGESGRTFVSQQIGYQVVSRPAVALVLGGFILALALGTLLWMRSGRLERLGPFGVVLAVLVTAVLLQMGQRARKQIPPTRAGLQMVQAEPGTDRVPVRGMLGLFDASGRARTVRARDGGAAWPPVAQGIGGRSRMTIEDLDRLAWRDLPLSPADVRWVQYSGGARLAQPLEMSLRFGEAGLTGELRGPADHPFSDGLLVTQRANLGVPLERASDEPGRARVRIGPGQVRPKGVLLSGGRITKTERERAAFLKSLLEKRPYQEPTLLAWTDGLEAGLDVEPELTVKEHALWEIPLRLEPTPPGEPVRVPWPLLRMEPLYERASDFGLSMRPIYSSGRGWTEEASGSSAYAARFVVPEAVRPMRLTEAVVHLNMTALGRPVRILAIRDGQASVIDTVDSPDGPETVAIPPDQLSFDGAGGLIVAFEVGDVSGGGQNADGREEFRGSQFWSVRHFGLEVAGTKREASE